jgi:hypothetical protein
VVRYVLVPFGGFRVDLGERPEDEETAAFFVLKMDQDNPLIYPGFGEEK